MTDNGHKIVYLLVEKGANGNKKTYWRTAGVAYPCRDGSLNLKLDIHPGLTFNIRNPKSNGERDEAAHQPEQDSGHYSEPEENIDDDDRSFPCDECRIVTNNEDAHALLGGGAVCGSCFQKKYKDCGRCGYAFPKTVRVSHCPKCGGGDH